MTNKRATTFTQEFLDWMPWIETVDEARASVDQRNHVDAVLGSRKGSPYYEVLANDLETVKMRTRLFGDIFETTGGVPREERELPATATSRFNGCVFCESVHSRTYSNLTKMRALMQRLLDDGVNAELPTYEAAIVAFSVKLTSDPESVDGDDVRSLRDQGIDDEGVLDIVHAAAIFANANRLMLSLGETRTKS